MIHNHPKKDFLLSSFLSNYKVFTSEFVENLEEMFPRYTANGCSCLMKKRNKLRYHNKKPYALTIQTILFRYITTAEVIIVSKLYAISWFFYTLLK